MRRSRAERKPVASESKSREPSISTTDQKNHDMNRRQRLTLIITLASAALTGPAWSVIASSTGPPTASVTNVENRVREVLLQQIAFSQENKRSMEGTISQDGSVEFWSSGGLRHHVPVDHVVEYDAINGFIDGLEVVPLPGGEAAIATFYSEGAGQLKGGDHNAHYLVRATIVFVKESGDWKIRAAHYSPIAGGNGTFQRTIQTLP
jgi:hypothetical protein